MIEEEKLILILSGLKKKALKAGVQSLGLSPEGELLWKTLRQCADNLVKEGLLK